MKKVHLDQIRKNPYSTRITQQQEQNEIPSQKPENVETREIYNVIKDIVKVYRVKQ